jgi:hypothetical protein
MDVAWTLGEFLQKAERFFHVPKRMAGEQLFPFPLCAWKLPGKPVSVSGAAPAAVYHKPRTLRVCSFKTDSKAAKCLNLIMPLTVFGRPNRSE